MITQELVSKVFAYKDGMIYRRTTNAKSGYLRNTGYLVTSVGGESHLNHRIIFLYHYGYLPECLDHIDGNKLNNRIENLRECTFSENLMNSKIRNDNTSGIKGVSWHTGSRRWRAEIYCNKKHIFLGSFDDKDVAEQVIRIERIKLHKEFCNHG